MVNDESYCVVQCVITVGLNDTFAMNTSIFHKDTDSQNVTPVLLTQFATEIDNLITEKALLYLTIPVKHKMPCISNTQTRSQMGLH